VAGAARYASRYESRVRCVDDAIASLPTRDNIPSVEADACSCARTVVSALAGGPAIGGLS
jgi:hypothetical protein